MPWFLDKISSGLNWIQQYRIKRLKWRRKQGALETYICESTKGLKYVIILQSNKNMAPDRWWWPFQVYNSIIINLWFLKIYLKYKCSRCAKKWFWKMSNFSFLTNTIWGQLKPLAVKVCYYKSRIFWLNLDVAWQPMSCMIPQGWQNDPQKETWIVKQ